MSYVTYVALLRAKEVCAFPIISLLLVDTMESKLRNTGSLVSLEIVREG